MPENAWTLLDMEHVCVLARPGHTPSRADGGVEQRRPLSQVKQMSAGELLLILLQAVRSVRGGGQARLACAVQPVGGKHAHEAVQRPERDDHALVDSWVRPPRRAPAPRVRLEAHRPPLQHRLACVHFHSHHATRCNRFPWHSRLIKRAGAAPRLGGVVVLVSCFSAGGSHFLPQCVQNIMLGIAFSVLRV